MDLKNTYIVDRQMFINWCEGLLLDFHMGEGTCVDEMACEKAENELKNGNEIILSIEGKPFSKMALVGKNKFEETLLD